MGIHSGVPAIGDWDRHEILFVRKHDVSQIGPSDRLVSPSTELASFSLVLRSQQATLSANVEPLMEILTDNILN
jgi:hypothetical protein